VLILITNDDGLRCRGIHVLQQVASQFGATVVIAPDRDRSGVSSAITLSEPLRLRRSGQDSVYELSGTPTDCVYIGLNRVLRDKKVDLVLSGINPGPNLGWDTLYSGTVAGAREAVLQGIPSIAFSLLPGDEMPYDEIRPWVENVIRKVIDQPPEPFTCINVNIPNPRKGPIKGLKTTSLGHRHYSKEVEVRKDPRGREYLWIGGRDVFMPNMPGSDCNAVREGLVAVTPLKCDLTSKATLDAISHWDQNSEVEQT
jgi:5'-nucleotidase